MLENRTHVILVFEFVNCFELILVLVPYKVLLFGILFVFGTLEIALRGDLLLSWDLLYSALHSTFILSRSTIAISSCLTCCHNGE